MKKYKAILFDLDGTLLDTTKGVIAAVQKTIKELGLQMPSEEILNKFVGPPMQLSFQNYFGMEEKEALKAANMFRNNYKEYSLFIADLYPGTLEVLSYLKKKGYKLAVATNKSHDNALNILKHFQIANYCECMFGSDLQGKLRKSDIIKKCLEYLKISNEEAVYIGDSIFDLEGSEKMGIDFIAVTYGYGFSASEKIASKNLLFAVNAISELKEKF